MKNGGLSDNRLCVETVDRSAITQNASFCIKTIYIYQNQFEQISLRNYRFSGLFSELQQQYGRKK